MRDPGASCVCTSAGGLETHGPAGPVLFHTPRSVRAWTLEQDSEVGVGWRSSGSRSGRAQSWLPARAPGPRRVGQAWARRRTGAVLGEPRVHSSASGRAQRDSQPWRRKPHEGRGRGPCPWTRPSQGLSAHAPPNHRLSRLIWQKLIFFQKFEDLINRRGGGGSSRRTAQGLSGRP